MKTINEILDLNKRTPDEVINELKQKAIIIPDWFTINKEYDPMQHPVMDKAKYADVVNDDGTIDHVTRIILDMQRLAVKRMSELCFGVPVKRIYNATTDKEKEAAKIIEAVYQRNRIDAVNIERANMLFAGCEVLTLWYAVEGQNNIYGINSPIKIRCRSFTPIRGDKLYPLFDENGDYIAVSINYKVRRGDRDVEYFDTYTTDRHLKWVYNDGWQVEEDEIIEIGKNPTLYMWRQAPIWESSSCIVYEMEWAMSRNGNYLRKNSKPVWVVCADEQISVGEEKNQDNEFRSILQYPSGSTANYVTWQQAIENLKFYISELRQMFFSQLQLPDFSFENMKTTPMSGEARKQLFIDAQLKVKDESGRLLEFLDREVNVVKAFVKVIAPKLSSDIDALQIDTVITPFNINDEKDTINNIMTATGGKAVLSQREGVEQLGWSSDVDKTMKELKEQEQYDIFETTN